MQVLPRVLACVISSYDQSHTDYMYSMQIMIFPSCCVVNFRQLHSLVQHKCLLLFSCPVNNVVTPYICLDLCVDCPCVCVY